ncbi:hypothetical protein [Streptomyces rubradiris]|uniref:DUF2399 domain-containing protein n=1 Tax=Streptomyces rubradiris TaxID=285531 RepID=A0ABQ3RAD5_STRRR|nr:hypothetical protein [Streptomyces rubradiris]GHH26121.1 hypothetical protein GCM10018792_66210 [Streptomyces rubradiris]GHI52826.1 hypothetical protein Srubr_26720 [Streptomyces rubradiris]
MPRITYQPKKFTPAHQRIIDIANAICAEYADQGFDLTLRQLYYQFVARDLLPNKQSEYKRLGDIVNDARLAGALDWDYIVDRTRNLRDLAHWDSPSHIIGAVAAQYRTHRWANQPHRVEVWVEKDALIGVIAKAAEAEDVPYFSCRGYTSQSELWGAAQRMIGYEKAGQKPVIIHLGDHDPSGVDMTRDIADRMALFEANVSVERIALNMDQVRRYGPPPNPAKLTDSRAGGYISRYGRSSWELDALDPTTLDELIRSAVDRYRDREQWERDTQAMNAQRSTLARVSRRWPAVETMVNTAG